MTKQHFLNNNLDQSRNTDMFDDFSNHYQARKVFMQLFNQYASCYNIEHPFEIYKVKDSLRTKYSFSEKDIILDEEAEDDLLTHTPKRLIVVLKKGLMVYCNETRLEILYDNTIAKEKVNEVVECVKEAKQPKEDTRKLFLISSSAGSYRLEDYDIKPYKVIIEDSYNEDFVQVHSVISEALKNPKQNGIIMLHGIHGSGKTSYIRHLINNFDMRFIFMPNMLLTDLSMPEFLPFISRYENSVLILEDCEDFITNRESEPYHNPALSTLLNLGDGLLGDALSLKVICTFNTNLQNIDKALLRKGRLIARYEFNELNVNKAQQLANKLDKNVNIQKPTTLADIYHYESQNFELNKESKIGFAYA